MIRPEPVLSAWLDCKPLFTKLCLVWQTGVRLLTVLAVVTHLSIDLDHCCLTSMIRREPEFSAWLDCKPLFTKLCLVWQTGVRLLTVLAVVTHLSIDLDHCCLALMIRPEPVLSAWLDCKPLFTKLCLVWQTGVRLLTVLAVVTHLSIDLDHCCLALMIRPEPVLSAWLDCKPLFTKLCLAWQTGVRLLTVLAVVTHLSIDLDHCCLTCDDSTWTGVFSVTRP